jgi:hypothetical protein
MMWFATEIDSFDNGLRKLEDLRDLKESGQDERSQAARSMQSCSRETCL